MSFVFADCTSTLLVVEATMALFIILIRTYILENEYDKEDKNSKKRKKEGKKQKGFLFSTQDGLKN